MMNNFLAFFKALLTGDFSAKLNKPTPSLQNKPKSACSIRRKNYQ